MKRLFRLFLCLALLSGTAACSDDEVSQNLIVIKTLSGCGPAAGEAVDCIGLPHVVGSVAGENTVLLIVDKEENVEEILAIFNDMLIMRARGQ